MSSEKQFKEITTDSHEFQKARERAAEMVKQMQAQTETKDDGTLASFKLLPQETLAKEHLMKPLEPGDMTERFKRKPRIDVYQQMRNQADEFNEFLEQQAEAREAVEAEADEDTEEETEEKPDDKFSKAMSTAHAKSILGKHKTFASYSDDRFNYYMRQAEDRLKAGKYYRAADSYTMANMFKPNDPLAFAGKSHALFATGEYLSSALFLSRAIEAFPEYAMFKIDLEAMIPDKDVLEDRIIEAAEWQQRSDSAELQFLLGYIHYQLDNIDKAKEAIGSAVEKMPESKAAATLKKAIDNTGK